jgi:uncharacterized protein YbjT (DUF2867 family)
MNVFVTGATGFVGREIVRQLHAAGHAIRILARNRNSRAVQEQVSRHRVEVHAGDVVAPASLDGSLAGCDAVIHLVGIISEVGRSTFEHVHTRGTEYIVAAAQQAGARRFVHMSALGTRPDAVSRYHKTKWAAEQIVRSSGLDWTIFRPSLIYGPSDHFVKLFAKLMRFSPVVPIIGNDRAGFQPVAIEAVAAAFVRSVSEAKSFGQTYDLCGPETLRLSEIVDQIAQATGRKRWKLRIPPGLARANAAFLEFVFPRLLRQAPPLNRDQLIMLQEEVTGDPTPANELFALQHPVFRQRVTEYLSRKM